MYSHHVEFLLGPFKEGSVVSIFTMHLFWNKSLAFFSMGSNINSSLAHLRP